MKTAFQRNVTCPYKQLFFFPYPSVFFKNYHCRVYGVSGACLCREFYGPVNNEVMSSRSVNSGTSWSGLDRLSGYKPVLSEGILGSN